MNPDKDELTPSRAPLSLQGQDQPTPIKPTQQQAATNLVRSQIDALYDTGTSGSAVPATQTSEQFMDTNPYDRTHASHPQPQEEEWKKYHSAWQSYYQKYYEGYYTHHLQQAKKMTQPLPAAETQTTGYFSQQPVSVTPDDQTLSKQEALYDLRLKLLEKVKTSAKKVRKSRHFIPITAGLIVVLLFVGLQYNRVFIANVMAYVTPGNIDPQNIVIDPTTDINVGAEPRLIIPKINVDVPVIYGVGNDYTSQMDAMQNGVAQFAIPGASSHPGQVGNTVLSGHSSNDLLDPGDYKFIFAQLEKLAVGDSIYTHYEGKRYTYTITKKEVVKPTEVGKLVYATDKPVLTLITCTPLGTAIDRLLVTAEQVSPNPSASTAAPVVSTNTTTSPIPGNSPTFLERIFGS